MSHEHTFSVDTACDCGVMLSDYVKEITAWNKQLRAALKESLKLPRPWLTGTPTLSFDEWDAIFIRIDTVLAKVNP